MACSSFPSILLTCCESCVICFGLPWLSMMESISFSLRSFSSISCVSRSHNFFPFFRLATSRSISSTISAVLQRHCFFLGPKYLRKYDHPSRGFHRFLAPGSFGGLENFPLGTLLGSIAPPRWLTVPCVYLALKKRCCSVKNRGLEAKVTTILKSSLQLACCLSRGSRV